VIDPATPIEVGAHRVALLPGVATMLEAFERDAAVARRRLLVECYIVLDDRMGERLATILIAAAARGLDVRLLYDPLGSFETAASFFDRLRAAGVATRSYRGHLPLPGIAPFPRDHGRVFVIDEAAYTGGVAWSDDWLPAADGGRGWHDVAIRVEGPIVADFAALFELRWAEAEAAGDHAADLDTGARHAGLRLIGDAPGRDSLIYAGHVEAIRGARSRIWIANSYFYPPRPMLEELTAAVKRGVDVRVLLPAESDLPVIERAARAEYADWLRRGLAILEFVGRMMHGKYAVIDDGWCTVGSFNVLPTSVGLANEVNLIVTAPSVVAAVAEQFRRDLRSGHAVDLATLARRPISARVLDDLASDALRLTDWIWGPRRGA
jgi:cardiolipin synthase